MVTIRLKELNDERAVYTYTPENDKVEGVVAYDRKKKERSIVEAADGYSNTYAFHALRRIAEYAQAGDFKKRDIVAWY